ncbi:hypothetical protein SprV_0200561900 [Sparganum proliferum]
MVSKLTTKNPFSVFFDCGPLLIQIPLAFFLTKYPPSVDTILQRHFNAVKQFAGRNLNDAAHPLHSDLMSAKSSRPMRRSFRLISCRTSAYRASSRLLCSDWLFECNGKEHTCRTRLASVLRCKGQIFLVWNPFGRTYKQTMPELNCQ